MLRVGANASSVLDVVDPLVDGLGGGGPRARNALDHARQNIERAAARIRTDTAARAADGGIGKFTLAVLDANPRLDLMISVVEPTSDRSESLNGVAGHSIRTNAVHH